MKIPVGAQRRFASTCRERDLQWAAMTTPPQTAISDLVPLMYRRAGSGSACPVRSGPALLTLVPAPGRSGKASRLPLMAGTGSRVIDGEDDRELRTGDSAGGPVPLPELMFPAGRLLPDFDLQITGRAEFLGRPVMAISDSPRLAGRARHERMSGLVDAELGILLRYQRVGPAQTDSAEFTRLTVSPAQPPGREQDPGPLPGVCPSGRNYRGRTRTRRRRALPSSGRRRARRPATPDTPSAGRPWPRPTRAARPRPRTLAGRRTPGSCAGELGGACHTLSGFPTRRTRPRRAWHRRPGAGRQRVLRSRRLPVRPIPRPAISRLAH